MNWLDALILGIVQGLTEFLPVSSSGHLELASALLNATTKENLLFAITVHAATALSTVVVFRKDILWLVKGLFTPSMNESKSYILKLAISAIPVAVVGLLFEDQIEAFFGGKILIVGFALIFTAVLLTLTHFVNREGSPVNFWQAIIIGVAQAIAILPGISRSGSTIATALLVGVDKQFAARFSFLMVLAPILGAAFLKLLDYFEDPSLAGSITAQALTIGFVASFLAGLVACQWMISIVRKGKLTWFAAYCFIIGLLAILTHLYA